MLKTLIALGEGFISDKTLPYDIVAYARPLKGELKKNAPAF
jgi:hypothetical protein